MMRVRTSTTLFFATRTSLSLRCLAVSSLSCPLCVQLHRPVVTVWFALVFTVLFTDD